jgi:hypothetical protein
MSILCRLFAVLTAPSLMGDIDLVGDHDSTRAARLRWRICLQGLHLNIFHHPFLTLGICHANGAGIRTCRRATFLTGEIATANTPEITRGGLICLL